MKSFNQLLEEQFKLQSDLAHPAAIRHMKEFARQVSVSQQPDISIFITQKLEQELNKFGYTLGELDNEIPFDKDGSEDFVVFTHPDKAELKNVYLSIEWERSSPEIYDHSPEVLETRVKMTVNEISPMEFDSFVNDALNESEELEEAVDPNFKKSLKDLSDSQLKQKLKYYREKDQDKYNAIVTEFEMRGLKEETDLEESVELEEAYRVKTLGKAIVIDSDDSILKVNVSNSGQIVLMIDGDDMHASIVIPANKAQDFITKLTDHLITHTS